MKTQFTLLSIILLFAFSCKDNSKTQDQTPIAEEELRNLNPNATFNQVQSIFDVLEKNPEYNSFLKLANQGQFFEQLKSLDNVTVFAPTNAAINRLSEDTYNNLRLPENLELLQSILRYHIATEQVDANRFNESIDATNSPYRLKTLNGGFIAITKDGDDFVITDENSNQSKVSASNIKTSNGVLYAIDHVITPISK